VTATVGQLVTALLELPQDAVVVLSKDAEGNGFSPVAAPVDEDGYSTGFYRAETTWSGEMFGGDDEERPDDAVEAVCLWPTN
jgi:hypothetical protein